MARKAPTFAQLIEYIGRDAADGSVPFAWNLYHGGGNTALTARQFLMNYRHLPKRKNGNALLHEVIVLEPQPHLERGAVVEMLHALAGRYCQERAADQLAWGRVHLNTPYPHIHLMISANAVRSEKRARLDKQQFARIQRELEAFKEQTFPELVGEKVYGRDRDTDRPKRTRSEGERVRRTAAASRKQQVRDLLRPVLLTARNRAELETAMAERGFELYRRGKAWGVIDRESGKRHRLATLGLAEAFGEVPERALIRETPDRTVEKAPERSRPPTLAPEQPSPPQSPDHPTDPRIAALLEARRSLEDIAREQINGFEREDEYR